MNNQETNLVSTSIKPFCPHVADCEWIEFVLEKPGDTPSKLESKFLLIYQNCITCGGKEV